MNHLMNRLYDRQGSLESDILRKMILVAEAKVILPLTGGVALARAAGTVQIHINQLRRELVGVENAIARQLVLGAQSD